jgi:hypothetical protein
LAIPVCVCHQKLHRALQPSKGSLKSFCKSAFSNTAVLSTHFTSETKGLRSSFLKFRKKKKNSFTRCSFLPRRTAANLKNIYILLDTTSTQRSVVGHISDGWRRDN